MERFGPVDPEAMHEQKSVFATSFIFCWSQQFPISCKLQLEASARSSKLCPLRPFSCRQSLYYDWNDRFWLRRNRLHSRMEKGCRIYIWKGWSLSAVTTQLQSRSLGNDAGYPSASVLSNNTMRSRFRTMLYTVRALPSFLFCIRILYDVVFFAITCPKLVHILVIYHTWYNRCTSNR